MGANEISNRMVAACYVKAGGPGDNVLIGDPGMFTMRSNSGFKDSVHVVLPPGIDGTDPLEEAGGSIALLLERPIARDQLVYTLSTVSAGEASATDPVVYGNNPMGELVSVPIASAAFFAFLAGTGPDPFQAPTDGSAFDPIDTIAIQYSPEVNGTDFLCTVWEVPKKGPALPPTFVTSP